MADADRNDAADAAALIRRRLKAIGEKDVATLEQLYADDVVLEIPLDGSGRTEAGAHRVFTGKEAVLAQFANATRTMRRIAFQDVDISTAEDGRRVFLEARGDMLTEDGTAYQNRYIFRFDVKDGKITRVREYANPVTAALAFGRPLG